MPETLAELRARAKRLGLKGYSRLRKIDLLKLLAAHKPNSASGPARKTRTRAKPAGQPAARRKTTTAASNKRKPGRRRVTTSINHEQQIERARYVVTAPIEGIPAAAHRDALSEDIDRLPAIRKSGVCLLPQKPGMLHGYWSIPHYTRWSNPALRLRLARLRGEGFEVLEEFPLTTDSGRWYFHLSPDIREDSLYLQLGFYQPDGEFVTAVHRGLARLLSLYAADPADRRMWMDARRIRELVAHSGDAAPAVRQGWITAESSAGGHPSSHVFPRPRGDHA